MKSDRSGAVQFAALPWRRDGVDIEVLLLTSRETKRWVIPKGWPIVGRTPEACAELEAFEEAGAKGQVEGAIGAYAYDKVMKDGSIRRLRVEVFPMAVDKLLDEWPEMRERERRWFATADAADAVDEADLGDLIRMFSAGSVPPRT